MRKVMKERKRKEKNGLTIMTGGIFSRRSLKIRWNSAWMNGCFAISWIKNGKESFRM
jgi:hypothetical protein